jgi:hypothetical protein
MPTYTYGGLTSAQWREACRLKLEAQQAWVGINTAYYNGEFPLTQLPGSNRDIFRRLLREARTNWCELVVNAVAERLYVIWFNFANSQSEDLAWLVWQDNHMDADSEMAQTDALVCGHTYVGVWPDESKSSGVRIDIEHPAQTTAMYAPGTRRDPVAVFKSFIDASQVVTDVLITADRVQTWRGDQPNGSIQDNTLGVVPYVELQPAPATLGPPRSELHAARSIQDRINTTIYNRLVATDFGAFRQITATGVKIPRNADGSYAEPFNVGSDRLLVSENEAARFGVIGESTLGGYLAAVQADVQHLAAITQTPPYYLLGQIINTSGDALKAAEAGLVSKVRRRAAHLGEGWEQVMRLALSYLGDTGAADVQAEVVWRDFETRSEAQLVDALTKMATLGVPRDVLWSRWGASPIEVADWKTRPEDALPLPAPTPTPAPAQPAA